MQVPALTLLDPTLAAGRPVGGAVGRPRDAARSSSREIAARDRQRTWRQGSADSARTRRARFRREPQPAGQDGQSTESIPQGHTPSVKRPKQAGSRTEDREMPCEKVPEASQPGEVGQVETLPDAVLRLSAAFLPVAETATAQAQENTGSQGAVRVGGAQPSFAAKMAAQMASLTAMSTPATPNNSIGTASGVKPEGSGTHETATSQAAGTTKGTPGVGVPAGVLASLPRAQGGADGAEARPGTAPSQAESAGGQRSSAPSPEPVLPLFLQHQAPNGHTAQSEAEGGTKSQTAPKPAAGEETRSAFPMPNGAGKASSPTGESVRAVPDAEPEGRVPTTRPVGEPGEGGEAVVKSAVFLAGGGGKAAGTAPVGGARAGGPVPQGGRPAQSLGEAAEQVAESIRAGGGRTGRQITVHLHPPELGRVRISLQSEGEAVRGTVWVDVPETLSKLQQEAAPLMQRLQGEGIDLRRLDVMLNQEQTGDQAGHEAAFRQGENAPDAWLPGAAGEGSAAAEGEAVVSAEADGSDDLAVAAETVGGSINVQV